MDYRPNDDYYLARKNHFRLLQKSHGRQSRAFPSGKRRRSKPDAGREDVRTRNIIVAHTLTVTDSNIVSSTFIVLINTVANAVIALLTLIEIVTVANTVVVVSETR